MNPERNRGPTASGAAAATLNAAETPTATEADVGPEAADEPAVSVVLPTYRRADELPGAVRSVLAQSHRPRELIVVDGGSDDGTDEVLAAVDDDRLRVLRREEPAGPGAARNAGVRAADGEYVAFVDADDRWRPRKLERQLRALARADASVTLSRLRKATAAGEPRTRGGTPRDVHEAVRRLDLPTYTSTLVVSRAAFADVGGFDESLPCFEDWELCLRLSRAYDVAFVDDPLVLKGTGGENISTDPDRLASAFETIDRRYDLPPTGRAQFLADVGVTHCEAGRLADGRPYLVRSLVEVPARPKVAVALALASGLATAGSPSAFRGAMERVYGAERLLRAGVGALRRHVQAPGRSDRRR